MDEPLDHVQRSRGDSSERRAFGSGRDVHGQLFDFCHFGLREKQGTLSWSAVTDAIVFVGRSVADAFGVVRSRVVEYRAISRFDFSEKTNPTLEKSNLVLLCACSPLLFSLIDFNDRVNRTAPWTNSGKRRRATTNDSSLVFAFIFRKSLAL